MKIKFNCRICKKEVEDYPHNKSKYCSNKCSFSDRKGKNNGMYGKKQSIKTRKLFSKQRKGKSNGHEGIIIAEKGRNNMSKAQKKYWKKHPEKAKRFGKFIKKFFLNHPEKHPNRIMAKKGFISKPQIELYECIKTLYFNKNIEMEYFVKTKHSWKFIDVAIPELKLGFEYDGKKWHKNKRKDNQRDRELSEMGWKILRYDCNLLKKLKKCIASRGEKRGEIIYKEIKEDEND